ncbi:MAG: hypothetical protein KDA41_09470, partial [Planctomycetales bacterium]|nr:hypothetical protein [Planctomycetales bacterium]
MADTTNPANDLLEQLARGGDSQSWSTVAAKKPAAASGDDQLNKMLARINAIANGGDASDSPAPAVAAAPTAAPA